MIQVAQFPCLGLAKRYHRLTNDLKWSVDLYDAAFVFLFLWIFYIYIGYPIIIYIMSLINSRPPKLSPYEPNITILIPAYNESKHIADTIKNKISLNYPREKVEIIVISDESDDGTDEIVTSFTSQGVKLIRQVPRQGKTSGLNLAIPHASGEIIIFSDANSIYEEDAVQYLLQNFSDPSIGYVTGKMVYTNSEGAIVGDGCGAYMRYENILRSRETLVGSIVGVDGGIDAVRRDLYRPMNADQLPDFVLPLSVVEQGFRVVYDERALLKEEALSSSSSEYRMRVRVSLRALWALFDKRKLFNPLRFPLFSFELISHKLLRYLAFVPQVLLFVINAYLASTNQLYAVIFVFQLFFYFLVLLGYLAERRNIEAPSYIALPYYLSLVNLAAAQAAWMFVRGKKVVIWKPRVG